MYFIQQEANLILLREKKNGLASYVFFDPPWEGQYQPRWKVALSCAFPILVMSATWELEFWKAMLNFLSAVAVGCEHPFLHWGGDWGALGWGAGGS